MKLDPDARSRLEHIGWRDDLPAARALEAAEPGRLARIIEQHRSGYRATDGGEPFVVQAPSAWLSPRCDPELRAAVGDWVLVDEAGTVTTLLPRHTLLKRGGAGEHYKVQLIAANVDSVLVVTGLDHDFNPRRIARYLVLVQGSGAAAVVVLTKRDLREDAMALHDELRALLPEGVELHMVNAKDPDSVAVLAPHFGAGRSSVLVGSSGAGKSTLTNTLLGIQRQKTAGVRDADSRGRHTTTHRALLMLPSGGCLIDTPGMRELKLTGEEDLAEAGFADVEALAAGCRFSDCQHQSEPGCAVLAALQGGTLDQERYGQWRKLQDELASAAGSLEAQRARRSEARVMGKALNKRLDEKYGRH